jgi:uncharacterized protein RhaS with RHS repeats
LTKDFWKVNLQGTPRLYLPDGTEIVFGRGGTSAYDNWYYATEIKKNNNTIAIHYGSSRRVDYVIDAAGRQIDFTYSLISNSYRLSSITCLQDPLQRELVSYLYPGSGSYPNTLSGVVFPDGDAWQYTYNAYKLLSIFTPYGGRIDYGYNNFTRGLIPMGYVRQHSVSSKAVSGTGLTNGTWIYDYGVKYKDPWGDPIHLDYTTITDPCGRVTTYHFFGYSGGYDSSSLNECYKYGLTRRKFTTDSSGKVEEAIEYTWDKLETPLAPLAYSVTHACHDNSTYVPVLTQQSIYHGGTVDSWYYDSGQDPARWQVNNPTNTYATQYSGIDDYGHAELIEEWDEIPLNTYTPAKKTTEISYWYNVSRNIVESNPGSVRIYGSFPGDFKSYYTYDPNGNMLSEDLFGVKTNHTYYANGNLKTSTDANNKTTSYVWSYGAISKITNPIYSVSRTNNWDGTVRNETNGRGYVTSYSYTPGMRIQSITPPVGNPTIHSYGFGANTFIHKKRGSFSDYTYYDGLGRERLTNNSLRITTTTARKSCGLTDYTDSSIGDKVSFDNLGRIQRITHKGGSFIAYNHISDTEIRMTDEEGRTTTNYYKTFGTPGEKYLTTHRNALGKETYSTYNILGSLLSTKRDGLTRSYAYDTRNFLKSEQHPESGVYSYERDNRGNLKKKTENGKVVTYTYDDLNRLKTSVSGSYYQNFSYDNNDNPTVSSSPGVTLVHGYDQADRMISKTSTINGKPVTITYGYDGNDNVTTIGYPSGTTAIYDYNSLNQVTRVWGFGGELKNINYFPSSSGSLTGLLKSYTRSNNQVVALTWDARRRMHSSGHPQLSLTYRYDAKGNMTYLGRSSGRNQSFTYDYINRLKTFTGPWDSGSYVYDDRDNRTSKKIGATTTSYAYNRTNNTLTGQTGKTYAYSGPNISRSGTHSFIYDPFNNILTAKNGSTIIGSYKYDAGNRRVYKNADNEIIHYHYGQSDNVLSETDQNGKPLYDYIYLNNTLVAKTAGRSSGAAVSPWLLLLLNGND